MKIPQAFEQFVRSIYPETPGVADSLESLAAAAIEDSYGNDLGPVLAYLNELLDGGHSDAELQYGGPRIRGDDSCSRGCDILHSGNTLPSTNGSRPHRWNNPPPSSRRSPGRRENFAKPEPRHARA